MGQFLQRTGNSCHIFSKIGLTDGRHDEEDATGDSRDDSGIHSKSEKVCGTAFSVRKIAEKCVNPGVIFGPFGVIVGHFGSFFGSFWQGSLLFPKIEFFIKAHIRGLSFL